MIPSTRRARHDLVSASLAARSDDELAAFLDAAPTSAVGVGGGSSVLDVDGTTVFAKRIPITDRELAHPHSTANLFELPTSCQYGMHRLAGPGFGAWRELAANLTVTDGVLGGETESFALLYHWRVLPGRPPVASEHLDVEAVVAQFGNDPAVRIRFEELAHAGSSLVLFLEHLPDRLLDRLNDALDGAETFERQLFESVAFLRSKEVLHMDGHFANLRADDDRIYLVDFGLAISAQFDLSDAERDFVTRHVDHDADYAAMRLVNWLVTSVCGVPVPTSDGPVARNAYVRRCASGDIPKDVPATVAGILVRHAAAAAQMNDFCWRLFGGDLHAQYPGRVFSSRRRTLPVTQMSAVLSGTLGASNLSFDEESTVPQGTVRWFDAERGFGFLALGPEADDLFVHASEIVSDDGTRLLREGQVVEFEVGEGDRGPQARRVRVTGDQAADAPLGVLGTVTWYEPGKGYGFITPEGGGAEIFVHSSAIVGGGVISEGQRVAFLVVDGEKGPQADHLLPLGAAAAPQASDGADGTVSWYDGDKGFGFVVPDSGGEDVFVHISALARGLTELSEGERVTYDVAAGDKGPQARNVQLVRDSAPRGARASSDRGRSGRPAESDGPARGGEGVVARYDAERGFGFITPDAGGADLFVHVSVVRSAEPLQEGDRVQFKVRQSDRGPQADSVERV